MHEQRRGRYRKIDVRMHDDERFLALDDGSQMLWVTLLTGPHTTACPGLSRVGIGTLSDVRRRDPELIAEQFRTILENGMAEYDERLQVLRLPRAPRYEGLRNGNQILGWWAAWQSLPESAVKYRHIHSLREALPDKAWAWEAWEATFGTVSKLIPEQFETMEQEQEQEQEQEKKSPPTPQRGGLTPESAETHKSAETEKHEGGGNGGARGRPDARAKAEALADLWEEVCPSLRQPRRPLAQGVCQGLSSALRRRSKLEYWRAIFEPLEAFFGEGDWRPDILWAVGPRNVAKIESGRYSQPRPGSRPKPTRSDQAQDMLQRMMDQRDQSKYKRLGDG